MKIRIFQRVDGMYYAQYLTNEDSNYWRYIKPSVSYFKFMCVLRAKDYIWKREYIDKLVKEVDFEI